MHVRMGSDAVRDPEEAQAVAARSRPGGAQRIRCPDTQPRGMARAFDAAGDGWRFPAGGPGKSLGEAALRKDLTKLQIRTQSGRNTALLTLARDVGCDTLVPVPDR